MKNLKIVVTGGAGFIGSHLCEKLLELGNNVYSIDNYFTGSVNNHLDGVNYIHGSAFNISELIKFKPDMVFHLGEYSRVEQSFDDIEKVIHFNKFGTYAVLEFIRKTKAKLIYAGSSTKYADDGKNYNASPYAWSKSSNTELVKNYGSWFDINFAITYFYNVYGPKEISMGKYATLIGLFQTKMRNKEYLTVVSPGNQSRNFTHVQDTVDALVLVGDKGSGDEYGIGDPISYTVLEVAKMFGGETIMLPPRRGNRMNAKVVSDKLFKMGWNPKIALEEYIKELKERDWK